jgi:sulfonate transport system substrate-binding protein
MKPRNLALLAAVGAVLTLSACGSSGSPAGTAAPVPKAVSNAQLAGVTLRVGDQKGSSEQVLLQAAGLLTGIPYHVRWATFTSGPPMLEAANDNAIDVGQVGNTPPIFSAAAGGKIDIVAALRSSVGDSVLVPKNSQIHSLADLRGRTIAVAKGSSANGTLLNTLSKAGLKPSDVTISYLQPADGYAAFSQGSVAAWAIWEPYVSQSISNLGARELVSGSGALSGSLSNGYTFQVANRASLADAGKNAAIADYVRRIDQADLWARTHQAQWAKLYAQETGIPAAIASVAVPKLVLRPISLDGSVVTAEQQLADTFTAAGQLPGSVDVKQFVDFRYNNLIEPLTRSN